MRAWLRICAGATVLVACGDPAPRPGTPHRARTVNATPPAAPPHTTAHDAAAPASDPEPARDEAPRDLPLLPDVDRQTVVARLFAVDEALIDPFATAKTLAPDGVQIMRRTSKHGPARQVARVHRVRGEPLAKTLARARPWFSALELPPGRTIVFEILTGAEQFDDIDVYVIEPDPIEIRALHLQAVVAPDGDFPSIDIRLSEAGKRHLRAMTEQLVGREIAIVVGDRVLWAPRMGGRFGDESSETLGFVRDAEVAARVREALRGDAAAAAEIAGDRITDGGSRDDVVALREAAKLPPPVTAADGTTRIEVGIPGDERVRLQVVVPAGWTSYTTEDDVAWNAPQGGAELPATIRIGTGCAGGCAPDLLAEQIEEELAEKAAPPEPIDAGGRIYPRVHTVVLDERAGERRLWARAVQHPEGTPPGLIRDRVEAWCFVRPPGAAYFLEAKLTGPPREQPAVLERTREICRTLAPLP